MSDGAPGSPFWQFSLDFYRRPGVAPACLVLQDECGVDVNLLLLLLWLARAKRQVSVEEVRAIEASSAAWSRMVVAPLRAVRRTLKQGSSFVAATEPLRIDLKAIELEAERLEQEALYHLAENSALGRTAPSVQAASCANIKAYEDSAARTFAKNAIDVLISALGETEGGDA